MLPRFALSVFALLLTLLCTGCNPAQKLVGAWELDTAKSAASLVGEGPMASMLSTLASQFKMEIEFKSDGLWTLQFSLPGRSDQSKGTWRFVKQEGQTLHLMMKPNDQSTEQEVQVKMIDDHNIELSRPGFLQGPGDGRPLPLRRIAKQ